MLGRRKQAWHDTDSVLDLFGNSRRAARKQYLDFMRAETGNVNSNNLSGGDLVRSSGSWEALSNLRKEHAHCIGDERILGDSDFVSAALNNDKLNLDRSTLRARQGWSFDKLVRKVCHLCDIQQQLPLKKARNNNYSKAKALTCFWGTAELGLTTYEIAQRLEISQQAVSKWVNKGQGLVENSGVCFSDIED